MGFIRERCTEQLFDRLRLPARLKDSEELNPIGRDLIHDSEACSALIPHPFRHGDYPDRHLDFYLRGQCFRALEQVTGVDDLAGVSVTIAQGVDAATCDALPGLLAAAVGLMRNEAAAAIPITLLGRETPRVRMPRAPAEIIPKLNTLAGHYARLREMNLEEVGVAAMIGVVLLPEEVAPLERHLEACGWDALLPEVRELVARTFARIHGDAPGAGA